MEKKQTDTVPIATKINKESFRLLRSIAEKSGLTVYTLLQVVIDCYLRYVSDDVEITDSMELTVNGFANFSLAKQSFCVCGVDGGNRQCKSIIEFVEKKGVRLPQPIMYHADEEKGKVFRCYRHDEMLSLFLLSIAPDLLPILRKIMKKENLLSLTDALKFAVKDQEEPMHYDITMDIKELFSDNSRDEFGENIDYEECGQYKRVPNIEIS